MDAYIATMQEAFGGKKPAGDDDDDGGDPADKPPVGFVPDLLADSQIYQWAGIGFGQ